MQQGFSQANQQSKKKPYQPTQKPARQDYPVVGQQTKNPFNFDYLKGIQRDKSANTSGYEGDVKKNVSTPTKAKAKTSSKLCDPKNLKQQLENKNERVISDRPLIGIQNQTSLENQKQQLKQRKPTTIPKLTKQFSTNLKSDTQVTENWMRQPKPRIQAENKSSQQAEDKNEVLISAHSSSEEDDVLLLALTKNTRIKQLKSIAFKSLRMNIYCDDFCVSQSLETKNDFLKRTIFYQWHQSLPDLRDEKAQQQKCLDQIFEQLNVTYFYKKLNQKLVLRFALSRITSYVPPMYHQMEDKESQNSGIWEKINNWLLIKDITIIKDNMMPSQNGNKANQNTKKKKGILKDNKQKPSGKKF